MVSSPKKALASIHEYCYSHKCLRDRKAGQGMKKLTLTIRDLAEHGKDAESS
jgi:hypothetical protein